ncbi:MAG: NAD(P)-dependent oxidoreductase [Pseudomonadota bacterium]
MMKILIAGGTGFVGLNAARAFADRGIPVVITSRKRHDEAGETLAGMNELISIEYVELSQSAAVFDLYARHEFSGVVMLAHAHQYARTRAASNAIYSMTLNCLDGAQSTGVERVVLASSVAIYGGLNPPFDETATFPTRVSYAGTMEEKLGLPRIPEFETAVKRAVEMIAFDYSIPMPAPTSGLATESIDRRLQVVALRYPIQWGPGYTAMGNPFSLVSHAAAGRISSLAGRVGYLGLPVHEFWNILSGTASCYVKDSASAIVTTMLADHLPRLVYNVSSGFNDIARDQLETLYRLVPDAEERIGINLDLLDGNGKPDAGFNANRLREDFGWRPAFDRIDDAFSDYLEWLKTHPF